MPAGIVGELVPLRNQQDMGMHCMPAGAILAEGLLCRWEPRFKNDSTLETWLTTHVWTVYIVLSLVVAFELLCSSYLSGVLFDRDEDDDFEDFPDEDRWPQLSMIYLHIKEIWC